MTVTDNLLLHIKPLTIWNIAFISAYSFATNVVPYSQNSKAVFSFIENDINEGKKVKGQKKPFAVGNSYPVSATFGP